MKKKDDPVKVDPLAEFDGALLTKLKKWLKTPGKMKFVQLHNCPAYPALFKRLIKPYDWLFDDVCICYL